jgi:hypothetical protein
LLWQLGQQAYSGSVALPRIIHKEFVIVCNPEGRKHSAWFIDEIIQSRKRHRDCDLSGTGESSSTFQEIIIVQEGFARLPGRLWFGRTMMGEWVKELRS